MNRRNIEFLLLLLLIIIFPDSSNAANKDEKKNKGLYSVVELGGYKGVKLTTDLPFTTDNSHTKSLRLILGYFINPYVSGGIGFGADRYENPGANTFPLFIDIRGYLKNTRNTPFIFIDAGKTIVFASQAQEGGNLVDTGIGYKFFIGKKTCLVAKTGYNYFHNKEWVWMSTDYQSFDPSPDTYRWFYLKRESITFSIGLMF